MQGSIMDFHPPFSVNDECAKGYTNGAPTYWIVDSEGNAVAALPPPRKIAEEIAEILNEYRSKNG
mgnify:FL=1